MKILQPERSVKTGKLNNCKKQLWEPEGFKFIGRSYVTNQLEINFVSDVGVNIYVTVSSYCTFQQQVCIYIYTFI